METAAQPESAHSNNRTIVNRTIQLQDLESMQSLLREREYDSLMAKMDLTRKENKVGISLSESIAIPVK